MGIDTGPRDTRSTEPREARLARILAECSDRLNAGKNVDVRGMVEKHPDLNPELDIALEALHRMDSSLGPGTARSTLGDFRIIGEMGRGGMGIVYEAWQTSMDRRVALKVLPPSLIPNRKAVARFELEAKAAGRLQHPNIVAVYGKGVEAGSPYYAMEYVQGETLDRVLSRVRPSGNGGSGGRVWLGLNSLTRLLTSRSSGSSEDRSNGEKLMLESGEAASGPRADPGLESRFDAKEVNLKYCLNVAEAFADIADALQYAHQKGVIHRDLKPANLILDTEGRLRILDFGLARLEGEQSLTVSGEFLGTPVYMSPEQAMAHRAPVDHRTDIYSLGATLYEVLTRKPPFSGRDYKDTLSQIIVRDPEPLRRVNARIPKNLETIVLKCLMKDPADRYRTAEGLAQDLRRCARGDPIEARPQPVLEKLARRAWRHKGRLLAIASALLLCLTTAVLIHKESVASYHRRLEAFENLVLSATVKIQEGPPITRIYGPEPGEGEPADEPAGLGGLLFEVAHAASLERGVPELNPLDEAEAQLREAIALFPKEAVAHYHLARALLLLDRDEEAIGALSVALSLDRTFVPALALKEALVAEPDDSINAVSQSTEETSSPRSGEPGWQDAWRRAHRAVQQKDWDQASDSFSTLLSAHPTRREAYLGSALEALLGRGRAYLEAGELDRAAEDFAAAGFHWRDLIEPVLLLGRTHHLAGKTERAGEDFEGLYRRLLHEDRDRASDAALRIASVYQKLEEANQGLLWADRVAESPERERLRAHLLVSLGRNPEALLAAKRAVALDPDAARSHEALAYVHYREGDLRSAATGFERAVELDPRSVAARRNLGFVDYRLGRYREAETQYRAALEIDPDHAETRGRLGETLRKLGKLEDSVEEHRRAVELDPGNPSLRHNLALALKDRGDRDGAAAALRKAAEVAPEGGKPARLNNLGRFLARSLRDYEGAVREYERALATDSRYWPAHYNRLLSLASLREKDRLVAAAGEALRVMDGIRESQESHPVFRSSYVHLLTDFLAPLEPAKARDYTRKALDFLERWVDRDDAPAEELNQYAWTLLTCRPEELQDAPRALEYARKAERLSGGGNPEILDTLAEAHFLNGDATKALETGERALVVLEKWPKDRAHREAVRKVIERNLARYRGALDQQRDDRKGQGS